MSYVTTLLWCAAKW